MPPAVMSFTLVPSAPVPSVIRALAMIASVKVTPTKDKPAASDRTAPVGSSW